MVTPSHGAESSDTGIILPDKLKADMDFQEEEELILQDAFT